MAVDNDLIVKNPFGFQRAGVICNDENARQAITKEQMKKFIYSCICIGKDYA